MKCCHSANQAEGQVIFSLEVLPFTRQFSPLLFKIPLLFASVVLQLVELRSAQEDKKSDWFPLQAEFCGYSWWSSLGVSEEQWPSLGRLPLGYPGCPEAESGASLLLVQLRDSLSLPCCRLTLQLSWPLLVMATATSSWFPGWAPALGAARRCWGWLCCLEGAAGWHLTLPGRAASQRDRGQCIAWRHCQAQPRSWCLFFCVSLFLLLAALNSRYCLLLPCSSLAQLMPRELFCSWQSMGPLPSCTCTAE